MVRAMHAWGTSRRQGCSAAVQFCEGMRHRIDRPAEKQSDYEEERNQRAL